MSRTIHTGLAITVCLWGGLLYGQPDVDSCSTPGTAFGGAQGTPIEISDTIVVSESVIIAELEVFVDISHPFLGDVQLDLSRGATSVRLHDGAGAGDDDLVLVYSDAGPPSGSLPYDYGCTMQPSGPGSMATFDGLDTASDWLLTIADTFPAEDDGVLNAWCLRAYASVPTAPPSGVEDLFCTGGPGPDSAQLSWSNPVPYQSISVRQDGVLLATLPGDATSYVTPQLAGMPPYRLSVSAVVAGATPACPEYCLVQTQDVTGLEACSSPGIDIMEGPHIDVITISEPQFVADVNTVMTITHDWIGDLQVDLTAPSAATVRLHNGGGAEADDIDLIYSDQGVVNGIAPYNYGCHMQPSGPGAMADLAGDSFGDWVLTIVDTYPASDHGTLDAWCVRTFQNVPSSPPPAVTGLTCGPGGTPGTADLSWSNPVPYSEIQIRVNGSILATLPSGSESYTTPEYPSGSLLEIAVEGVFVGSVPSCGAACEVQILLEYNSFSRGDVNTDGTLSLPDAILLLDFLFGASGTTLSCHDAADVNDDDALGLADAISLLSHLFSNGPTPPPPGSECGSDPTSNLVLTCQSYPPCLGVTDAPLAGHVLRRIAFGPSPGDLEIVLGIGVVPYIDEQLDPDSIDDSTNVELQVQLAGLSPDSQVDDLYRLQLIRAMYSRKQLQEQLTSFWEAHFNTYLWTVWSYFVNLPIYNSSQALQVATFNEHDENQGLRDNALSRFVDLLEVSATSVTMLIYLDNISNVAGDANENYARELLELHTMGVDNGYTQADIEELARCFTGWNICKKAPAGVGDPLAPCVALTSPTGLWSFNFDANLHDYGSKVLFPGTAYELVIPDRPVGSPEGVQDGFEVIALLSSLPQTAQYVSTKLIQKLVNDDAPPNLVADCISVWLTTDGDLQEVVSTILHSNEFLGSVHRWNKVETPMENLISTARAFDGVTSTYPVLDALYNLGQVPFNFGTPDGFPESGADQLGTALLLERFKFAKLIYESSGDPDYDLTGILIARGVALNDVDAVVDEFLALLYQGQHTPTDRQLAIDFLATDDNGNPSPLDPGASDYELRLGKLATFMASWPQGLKQ